MSPTEKAQSFISHIPTIILSYFNMKITCFIYMVFKVLCISSVPVEPGFRYITAFIHHVTTKNPFKFVYMEIIASPK